MSRIPSPPIGPNRDPTLWEFFKPWAWSAWMAACFMAGVIGESSWAWVGAGVLWVVPVLWVLNRAGQRYRANRAAKEALDQPERQSPKDSVAGWWRGRHLWFDDLRPWERRLLKKLLDAEDYFDAVPLKGLRGWLHKREVRRRIADLRYHLGTKRNLSTKTAREARRKRINGKMDELRKTLDLEVDAVIADDIASDDTIDQLRQVIVDLDSSTAAVWEDEAGEALR